MSLHEAIIREEKDGTLSFGDYTLEVKQKVSGFEHNGDIYKVKTYYEITKLERNDTLIYESVPGTKVYQFSQSNRETNFLVTGSDDAQITLELEEEKEYRIYIDGTNVGKMKTNLGGKLVLSVELSLEKEVQIKVVKC